MTLIATKNVTLVGKNGRRFSLILGKPLSKAQANNLSVRQLRNYTEEQKPANTRVPYSYDEAVDLAGCYVTRKGDLTATVAAFMELNPGQKHTAASVKCAAFQLRALDPNFPGYNKWVAKTVIIAAALDTQADYFDPTGEVTEAYDLAS